jgi:hypothetical protein
MADAAPSDPRCVRNSARVEARSLLASRTRELMEARGVNSIRTLATSAGLGTGTVADILSGTSDPRLSTMLGLVRALGLGSIEELLSPLGTSVVIGTPHERPTGAP